MYSKRPPSSLDSCFITVCLRALCVKHCTHTAVMTKRPPHTLKKALFLRYTLEFIFALDSCLIYIKYTPHLIIKYFSLFLAL